jgi:hypothetical protein
MRPLVLLGLWLAANSAPAPTVPPAFEDRFEVHGPGLTVGKPRRELLDRSRYTLERCLTECLEDRHGRCAAATFHNDDECKLFGSYTGIVKSVVANKITYVRK